MCSLRDGTHRDQRASLTPPTCDSLHLALSSQANNIDSMWPFKRALVLDRHKHIANTVDLNSINDRVDALAVIAKTSLEKIDSIVSTFTLFTQMSSLESIALLQACAKGDTTQVRHSRYLCGIV